MGVVRPKSLMPTTPHGPQRLESFMLGVPSRQRSNLLCVGGKGVGPAAGITLAGFPEDFMELQPTRYGPAGVFLLAQAPSG